jgi:hypothetical protein
MRLAANSSRGAAIVFMLSGEYTIMQWAHSLHGCQKGRTSCQSCRVHAVTADASQQVLSP